MKTALSIIGIVFLVLIGFFAAFIGFVVYVGSGLDASSKAYSDHAISAIGSAWSKDELIKRESPQFRAAASDAELTNLFNKFSALGPMQSYGGSTGRANVNFNPASGLQIMASYVAQATFQKGKAKIRITLIQINGEWRVFGFRVDSPVLFK